MMNYMVGFYYFEVTVTTKRWGTFRTPVWARTAAAAVAFANKRYKTTNARWTGRRNEKEVG